MRAPRILLITAGIIGGLMLLILIAAVIILNTGSFRNYVREKIIAAVEENTGGKAEVGAFNFYLGGLRAEVDNFVLHGTEGPDEPPLFRAKKIVVGLKILSVLHHQVSLDLLAVTQPHVYLEVKPDGSTNIPTPRIKRASSNKEPIQTLMDLAVRHVSITDGLIQVADRKTPFNVEGDNLTAKMTYSMIGPKYDGTISVSPVWMQKDGRPRLPVNTNLAFTIRENRIDLNSANFKTPESNLDVSATVANLSNPSGSVQASGRLMLLEFARAFGFAASTDLHRAPPLDLSLAANMTNNRLDLRQLQARFGRSRVDASGVLDDLKQMAGVIHFDGRVVLGEIGRMLSLPSRPEGLLTAAGDVRLNGTSNYDLTAWVAARDVSIQNGAQGLSGMQASADIAANPHQILARNLRLAALGGTLSGNAQVVEMAAFRFDGAVNNFDTRYLAKTYASRNLVWDGIISGPLHVAGNLKAASVARSVTAKANLGIRPGPNGVPLSGRLDVAYDGPRDSVDFGNSYLQLPSTRLSFSGTLGSRLQVALVSRNLNALLPAIAMASSNPPQQMPVTLAANGVASFTGTVTGSLSNPQINGHVQMTSFSAHGQQFNLVAADLGAQKSNATVRNAVVDSPSVQANLNASVGLTDWKPQPNDPVSAQASVRSRNIEALLAAAGSTAPVTGAINATAQVGGTVGDPRGSADLTLVNGRVSGEPFHRIHSHVEIGGQFVRLTNTQVVLPAGQVNLNASFEHPLRDFQSGKLNFELTSTPIRIEQLRTLQERRPGLQGTVSLNANGAATLLPPAPNRTRLEIANLTANVKAHALEVDTKQVGDLTVAANTRGQDLVFSLHSDLANSNINGNGALRLAGDYPLTATITFDPVRLAPVMRLVSSPATAGPQTWDGVIAGRIDVSGPLERTGELQGRLDLTTLQIRRNPQAVGGPAAPRPLVLRNASPVVATLDRQVVRIQSAHLIGPETDFAVTGAAYLQPKTLDIQTNGKIGLKLAETFDPDIFASGDIALNAAIKGPFSSPAVNGRLQLQNASFNYLEAPNGLSNANGTILFNGQQAVIDNLSGESGGGKITAAGYVRYGGPQVDFRLRATADHVRVRQGTVTVQVSAAIDYTGTTASSLVSGDVTILQVAMHSHTDTGNLLSQAGAPPQAPTAKTGLLAGMRFDVRIATSPGVQFLTTLSQNLQATADLRLRGTASSPGMTGRVNVTHGDIVFFGTKYTIDRGTVAFYNPARIEPVLNVNLSTAVQGINVTLAVNGPINSMKLTYHSDPPLQFSDIVQLLATGKPPTSDPVLAAQQPPAPQQNWEQMGASAVLSQAVAAPVAGRLQRLFGVTKIKIDPQIIGSSNTPQARMTIQQQVSKDLTFTYIQDVTQANPQIIRIEWALDPTWSAVALRQENGEFGLDFFYKKRFR